MTTEGPTEQGFKDQILQCCDCGSEFTFTAGEQKDFQARMYSTPRRCRGCRAQRRLAGKPKGGRGKD